MLANDSATANEIHLHIEAITVEYFLYYLRHRAVSWDWVYTLDLVTLGKTYECETFIHGLLDGASCIDPGEFRFDAFVAVCEANHLIAACRLLRKAGKGEVGNAKGKSLRPNSQSWMPRDAERLSARWLWALTCAVQWAEGILAKPDGWIDRTRDDYWIAVVGEFMSRITMCESFLCSAKVGGAF